MDRRLTNAINSLHTVQDSLTRAEARLSARVDCPANPFRFATVADYQRLLNRKRARVARLMLAAS